VTVLTPAPAPNAALSEETALPRLDPVTRLPIIILFPHSRCNCRCVMCDIWRDSAKTEIAPEKVAGWIAEWNSLGVERVVLSGGEALLHSGIWELCAHLRSGGMGITILSTGILLRHHAADVVRFCDDVVVSLDGPAETHDRIRNIPGAFAKLAQGVAAVKALDARVSVSARCTVQRTNCRSLRVTVSAARDVGLDRISFLAADVSSDAFNRPVPWSDDRVREVALSEDDVIALETELDALARENAQDFATGFIAESPGKLRSRLLQYYAALRGDGEFAPNDCNAPWVSSVIEADGTVRPCFFQPPLGNIHAAESLASILNSDEALAWRRGLDVTRDAICRRCVCTLSLRDQRPAG
jgi:Fe-coproporphyrin III synthase